jgi:flagellar biosynthesis protein FliQ
MKIKTITKIKKGALSDLFIFMAVAFAIVMFSVVMYYIGNRTYDSLILHSPQIQKALGNDGNATDIINHSFGKVLIAYESMKWITTMLIFGFALSILISSFLVKTNPIFFVPYIIILIIAIIVSVPLSNTYEVIYKNPVLASSFVGFWGATWIFLHLPIWITVIGIFAGVLMFINVVRSY